MATMREVWAQLKRDELIAGVELFGLEVADRRARDARRAYEYLIERFADDAAASSTRRARSSS